MRVCPACHAPMNAQNVQGTEIDMCARCAGVFLDADEGHVVGVDGSSFFGLVARRVGDSERLCPDHGKAMVRFAADTATGAVEIERAECCGGIFLDAGEAGAMRAADQGTGTLTCPTCKVALRETVLHEMQIDECTGCDGVFLEGGEPEKAGIETSLIFGDSQWAAPAVGAAGLCPVCAKAMTRHRPEILGQSFEADYASCCGGVWVDRALEPRLRSASRRAVTLRADAQFASGQEVEQPKAALQTPDEIRAGVTAREHHMQARLRHARDERFYAEVRRMQYRGRGGHPRGSW